MLKKKLNLLPLVIVSAAAGLLVIGPLEADRPEYAAGVFGKNIANVWMGRVCTGQRSERRAADCARKRFREGGGLLEVHIRQWQCKGWMAAAMAPDGRFAAAWCRESEDLARQAALATCLGNRPAPCLVFYTEADN